MRLQAGLVFLSILGLAGCGGSGGGSRAIPYRVMVTKNGNIWAVDADGTNPTQITTTNPTNYLPVSNPSGSLILFDNYDGTHVRLYTVEPDGSNLTLITPGAFNSVDGGFSPDGSKIVFASNRDEGGANEIYICDVDGSNVLRLTNRAGEDRDPSFLPDGRIIYTEVSNASSQLVVMNADGSSPTPISTTTTWDGLAQATPNGKRIVFNVADTSEGQIATMKTNGTDIKFLTPDTEINGPFGITPDGKKIVFETSAHGGGIDVMDIDGKNRTLVINGNADGYDPGVLPIAAH